MKRFLLKECMASIVVFLVSLPLCMGVAIASGVPPALGLLSAIVGGILVGALTGSPLQISGPAAGLIVIVWQINNKQGIEHLGLAVFLGGVIQFIAGFLRLGGRFRAVTQSVIYGMLAGIGVLIFASQFHVMLDKKPSGNGIVNLLSIPRSLQEVFISTSSPTTFAAIIGCISILTILAWSFFRPKVLSFLPGPLISLFVAVGVAKFFAMPVSYVSIPDDLLASIHLLSWRTLQTLPQNDTLISGITLALVASTEGLLCASAVDQMHEGIRTNYNKTLWAQGVGNMICGALGALPVTGVIVRSSVNVSTGAKTRISGILHGFLLLLLVVTCPFLLNLIPTSALAAILVYTGAKLVNPKKMKEVWTRCRIEFAILTITLITIVCIDLLKGILLGFCLSILKLVFDLSKLEIHIAHQEKKNHIDVHVKGCATFLQIPKLANTLELIPNHTNVAIHIERLTYIDQSCVELFKSTEKQISAGGGCLNIDWETLINKQK